MSKYLERIHRLTGGNKIEFHTILIDTGRVYHSPYEMPLNLGTMPFVRPVLAQNLVNDSVFDRFIRAHEEVAVHVCSDFIQFLARVLGEDFV